jgi:hypothetical protein
MQSFIVNHLSIDHCLDSSRRHHTKVADGGQFFDFVIPSTSRFLKKIRIKEPPVPGFQKFS